MYKCDISSGPYLLLHHDLTEAPQLCSQWHVVGVVHFSGQVVNV